MADDDIYEQRRKRAEQAEREAAQPVPYEEHVRADAERFERRREEARENHEDLALTKITLMRGDGPSPDPDPDMEREFERREAEIREEQAKLLADRLAAIDREEQQRLDRTKGLYGRD